jgi:mono/diheme cytochrome c family protein
MLSIDMTQNLLEELSHDLRKNSFVSFKNLKGCWISLQKYCPLQVSFMVSLLLMLTACGQETPPPATSSPLGVIPAEPQRPGDPEAGYKALVNNAYVTCGVPYSAYQQAELEPPSHAIPGREGRNAELPYNLTSHITDDGVELVTSNCLGCHAGVFNDKLIIGLGNEFLDFTDDPVLPVESIGAYITDNAEAAQWRKWADRVTAIAPFMMTDTVGVNPANNLTLALLAHRDPKTLAWSKEPLMELPPTEPLPVSVPPWWRVKKKHAMFYSTEGRGDHARFMMLVSTVCTDTVEEARSIDAYFADIRAYLASLEPPDYPFAIDEKRAEQGRSVFEAHCTRCHGTYGEDWTYPNLVIGVEEVGTDPALAMEAVRAKPYLEWYNRSFYGERSRAAPAPGYIAPPLDGVWATAPYIHNGSVPTLEALLNSQKRPKFWSMPTKPSGNYNQQTLGWNYSEYSYGKNGAKNATERRRIYDTTLKGYSNQGHLFGDALTDEERSAVLEYIKTL